MTGGKQLMCLCRGRSAWLNISRSEVGVNSFVAHCDLKTVVNHSEAKLWGGVFSTSTLPELFNLSTAPPTSKSWAVYYFCPLTKRECCLLTQPPLASEISNMIQRFSPLKSHWFNMAQIGNDLQLFWPDSCLEAHLKWTISQSAPR